MWHTNLHIYVYILEVYVRVYVYLYCILCYINEDANWHLSDTKLNLQNVEQVRATDLQQYTNIILSTINHHKWILFCIHLSYIDIHIFLWRASKPDKLLTRLPTMCIYLHTYSHLKQQTLVRKYSTFLCFSCVPTELTDTRMAQWKEKN